MKAMKTRKEMLEEFVAQDPNDSFSRYALALELEKETGPREAVDQLREVVSRDPGYVAAYQQLGRMLAQTGFQEQAREVYRQGIELAIASGDQRARSEMQEALEVIE
jgi:cytochrome c-type biogenesis protein CcmH/NrfG